MNIKRFGIVMLFRYSHCPWQKKLRVKMLPFVWLDFLADSNMKRWLVNSRTFEPFLV